MDRFSPDQVARARATLADPDQTLSSSHRVLRERIARHVVASTEAQLDNRIISLDAFRAALRNPRLTCIDGGRK